MSPGLFMPLPPCLRAPGVATQLHRSRVAEHDSCLRRIQVRVNTRLKVNRYISKKLQAEREAAAAAGTPNLELPNAPGAGPVFH